MFERFKGLALLCMLAVVAVSAACEDGLKKSQTGEILITPSEYSFPKIAPGDNVDREVAVENTGAGDLLIRKITVDIPADEEFELFWRVTQDGDTFQGIARDGTDRFDYPIKIASGERLWLVLNYAPNDIAFSEGTVVLDTNLPDAVQRIPVKISEAGAEIAVSPRTVDFDRVAAGDDATRQVTVSNIGQATLNFSQILLNGSQDFTPLINGKDPRRQPEILQDPDGDGSDGLAPDGQFQITVRYAPQVEGPDTGELSIFSDDPQVPEFKVNLIANGSTPCLAVNPPALEFRTSLVNRTDSRPLAIESCGDQQVQIDRIRLADDSDPAFELDAEILVELPAILPGAAPDAPPPSRTIRVAFTPREQRIHNGTLIIESNDPFSPSREVSLLGRGVLNACPQARAAADDFDVLPLDVVVLDGTPSIDQDGPNSRPVEYEWVITSRPEGSVSQPSESFFDAAQPANGGPEDDNTTPTALFFVDLAGTYTAELRVRDNLGLDSIACENAAVVTIVAKPDQAIHVQLVWDTPGDEDQTDHEGADLDLHLLHPNADNWFSAPYDAHYANPVPDWGQLENPSDDPSLDIDDINGAGPENVNLDNPENTETLQGPYLVGVHYYSSRGRVTGAEFGPSCATVRVFLKGELAWDYTEDGAPGCREMEAEGHFWDVAQITWPEARVVTRDRYFTQRP